MPTANSTAITSRLCEREVGVPWSEPYHEDTEENKLIYTELFNQYADSGLNLAGILQSQFHLVLFSRQLFRTVAAIRRCAEN